MNSALLQLREPFAVNRIEDSLEAGMRAAQLVDHRFRPLEIFELALQRPAGRRRYDHVAQIADLVRKLDELRPRRERLGMDDLQPLTLFLEDLLVVGDFEHDA